MIPKSGYRFSEKIMLDREAWPNATTATLGGVRCAGFSAR
jgi:hypothetical protein